MASIVCDVRVNAILYLVQLILHMYASIAAPLLVVAACGMNEEEKKSDSMTHSME